jgi:hypothetical protein
MMRQPPKVVHRVFACVAALAGWRGSADFISALSARSSANASLPFFVSWSEIREMLGKYVSVC